MRVDGRGLAAAVLLGALVGVIAGVSSAGFLLALAWATDTREAHPWLLWLLPLAGFLIGLTYHYGAGRAREGNSLIIDEIHDPQAWIPRRIAALVCGGTVLTHLCGGSAGREGTALQMAGSLTDGFSRHVGLAPQQRRTLLIAALAGGFGAVFGVPIAGWVFGLEVQASGRVRYDAVLPALAASVVGDLVVRALSVHHTPIPRLGPIPLDAALLVKVALAGIAFGLVASGFAALTHGIKQAFAATRLWPPLRPVLGGVAIIALTTVVGSRDYLGLSIPLITASLAGGMGVVGVAFALKLLFTAVTLGSGFQGGEVTPLFVIGATLGATLGSAMGVPVPVMAALGFVAVFAGAANVPVAGTIMGIELFGADAGVLFAVACGAAYVFSPHRSIYGSRRFDPPAGERGDGPRPRHALTVHALVRRRPRRA